MILKVLLTSLFFLSAEALVIKKLSKQELLNNSEHVKVAKFVKGHSFEYEGMIFTEYTFKDDVLD